jgi:hypothetical protein
MNSNRIKLAAAGVVAMGTVVVGAASAEAAVPSVPSSSSIVHLPFPPSPSVTAEALSDGSVLVDGTGFAANHTITVIFDDGTGRDLGEYPTVGANGNFETEFPAWFVGGCYPSGAQVYAHDGATVTSNSVQVPNAGCVVPPPPGGGGSGGGVQNPGHLFPKYQ